MKRQAEPGPLSDYGAACEAMLEVVHSAAGCKDASCSIEVIPFHSTVILDTRREFQAEGMVRIRISHTRGLHQPAGMAEEKAMKVIVNRLRDLGLNSAK
jgi:hypothetical protein